MNIISKILHRLSVLVEAIRLGVLPYEEATHLAVSRHVKVFDSMLPLLWADVPPATDSQRELRDNGVTFLKDFLTRDDISRLNEAISEVKDFGAVFKDQQVLDILCREALVSLVLSYLGPHARLDTVRLSMMSKSSHVSKVSEFWHFDIGGHRLKAFIYLDESDQPTHFLLGTHTCRWARHNFCGSRVSKHQFKNAKEVPFTGRAGDCLVFDSNMIHRGNYSPSTIGRNILVVEYSDLRKSRLISVAAPQGTSAIRLPRADNAVLDAALINREMIIYQNDSCIVY